jgi:Luciferase
MDGKATAHQRITEVVAAWPGISTATGSRGEWSFRLGKKEIGHLHGSSAAHFFFDEKTWLELAAAGRITYHPVFPEKVGPAARRITSDEDIADVIELLRLNYDRRVANAGSRVDA